MVATRGINHPGLSVKRLEETRDFFTELLGWTESGHDPEYPRTAVSDGTARLTLWQVDHRRDIVDFDMRSNVGLHHLALEVDSDKALEELAERLGAAPGVDLEFTPELMGDGPRRHFICREPGGLRIEFTWPGPR